MIDPEMQALLSGHAAGTLTPDEKKRLHEAALKNQAIFDAMADEEPLRAALTSSLAKQGLLRALQKIEATRDPLQIPASAPAPAPIEIPKTNNWLWGALAACLVVGAATLAYWPSPKQETQEVAVAIKPQSVAAPAPPLAPQPAAKQSRTKAAPSPPPLSPPAPAPAQAPVAIAESTPEKREAKSVEEPQAPAAALADSARREIAETASNSFRERNAPSVAKLASVPPPIVAEIFNGSLILRAANGSYIYAFLIDGESVKPLTTTNEARRSIPIGTHSTKAEVWLIITTAEDPVLARALTGVLPLPTRNWIKLKTNP
jgi:hypothetical protein